MHPAVAKLTVVVQPYFSQNYTTEVLQALVGDMAEIDWGKDGYWNKVRVKFKTAKDADFFRELCKESGWKVEDL